MKGKFFLLDLTLFFSFFSVFLVHALPWSYIFIFYIFYNINIERYINNVIVVY